MHPDQDYYFQRYGWLLQLAPPAQDTTSTETPILDSLSTDSASQRKGLKGLFKKNKDKPKKEKRKRSKDSDESEAPIDNNDAANPEEEESEEGNSEGGN